jgi:excisionase family DNA binding protein
MPLIIDNEEYLSVDEACAYLGGVSRETLRRRTKASGIKKYSRGVTRNVYYRKIDLDRLNQLRPVDDKGQ